MSIYGKSFNANKCRVVDSGVGKMYIVLDDISTDSGSFDAIEIKNENDAQVLIEAAQRALRMLEKNRSESLKPPAKKVCLILNVQNITWAMKKHVNVVAKAAEELGCHQSSLYRSIQRLKISIPVTTIQIPLTVENIKRALELSAGVIYKAAESISQDRKDFYKAYRVYKDGGAL